MNSTTTQPCWEINIPGRFLFLLILVEPTKNWSREIFLDQKFIGSWGLLQTVGCIPFYCLSLVRCSAFVELVLDCRCGTSAPFKFLVSLVLSFPPRFVVWVRLCDWCSLWRYLQDLSLDSCGLRFWFLAKQLTWSSVLLLGGGEQLCFVGHLAV